MSAPAAEDLRGTDEPSPHVRSESDVLPYLAALTGLAVLIDAWPVETPMAAGAVALGTMMLAVLAFARQLSAMRTSAQEQSEATARNFAARFEALAQHSSDILTILDAQGRVEFVSPAVASVLGHSPSQLVGTRLTGLLHPDDVEAAETYLASLARDGEPASAIQRPSGAHQIEWRIANAKGDWISVVNVGTNRLLDPVVKGIVLNTRDVTEENSIRLQYRHQAFSDPLTDLANRSLFVYQVGHALTRAVRLQQPVTVLVLDLDNFKTVNDSLGHAVGDQLIVEAARRLVRCVRDSDLVARLGGDEFAILIEDSTRVDDANVVADRIGRALAKPFSLNGKDVFVSASIGIAGTSRGETADELVRNADVAMYVAKTRGKGVRVFFEPAMHAAALERLVVEADLRSAIECEEFLLHYQPIVQLDSGEIIGAEALVRWSCRERGIVAPSLFIPIAEETGLIVPIGRWVLRRACHMAREWEVARGKAMHISVNLSSRQLREPGIVDDVRDALRDSGLAPQHLVLELTESMLMHDTELSIARLNALKQLGVALAIDDFGTGYSSLSYLQRYPIDILKIDRSFVEVIDRGDDGPVLASAIVAIGDALRMSTVAEGIETEEQRAALRGLGCELGQGYLFAPPVDEAAFYRLLLVRGARSFSPLRSHRKPGAAVA